MKLESLKLTNFRGFREFEITFDPQFTVLLGGNMAGKTAVLDGAALVLCRLLGPVQGRDIEDDDVHQAVVSSGGVPLLQSKFPAVVEAKLVDETFHGGSAVWHLSHNTTGRSTTVEAAPYTLLNYPLDENLPVIAHYGAHRNWNRKQTADDLRGIGNRYDGYVGAFDIQTAHAMMAGWMRKQTYAELQRGNGYAILNLPQ